VSSTRACGPCRAPAAADSSSAGTRSLAHLCKKENLERALQLVENGHVHKLVAEPSGRTLFQVQRNPAPCMMVSTWPTEDPAKRPADAGARQRTWRLLFVSAAAPLHVLSFLPRGRGAPPGVLRMRPVPFPCVYPLAPPHPSDRWGLRGTVQAHPGGPVGALTAALSRTCCARP
jgi:hypothetical protein